MAANDGLGLYALYTTQFSTNLEMLLQQMQSKLRPKVSEGFHVGKMASPVNQIGAIKSTRPAGRFAPKLRVDADFTRRWVFPIDYDIDQLIDTFDELKTIVDPKSRYASNAAAAAARDWDDEIIRAAIADASIGQDAASLTTETFDTTAFRVASTFGSSAASGLIVPKLIEAKRILRHYHNDLEVDPPCLIAGSLQESDLLNQAQVTSRDFNDQPVVVNGKVTRLMGFDIVYSERLPIVTTNVRGLLAFVKSGIHLGLWKDMTNNVSKRTDLSGEPFDLYTMYSCGATRTQPGKIIQILCADSTGVDITP